MIDSGESDIVDDDTTLFYHTTSSIIIIQYTCYLPQL